MKSAAAANSASGNWHMPCAHRATTGDTSTTTTTTATIVAIIILVKIVKIIIVIIIVNSSRGSSSSGGNIIRTRKFALNLRVAGQNVLPIVHNSIFVIGIEDTASAALTDAFTDAHTNTNANVVTGVVADTFVGAIAEDAANESRDRGEGG